MQKIIRQIAAEIKVNEQQVRTAVELLDGGATVPFIARYRKEVTGGLDDIQLRELEYRLGYLRELEDRRDTVLKSIEEQGKLTPELRAAIDAAATKQDLEDLYLPYKPRRRTKGQIARENGIEPLADALFADPTLVPADAAAPYVKAEKNESGDDFSTVQAVLDGVRDILSERWAEDAPLVQSLRAWLWSEGLLTSKLVAGKDENNPDHAKFREAFGQPIGAFQSIQHMCADMIIWIDAGELLAYEALWKMDNGLPAQVEVSQAKAFCNEKCPAVARNSQSIHGGIGFMMEFDLHLWLRRITAWSMRLGTTFEHRERIARALLDSPGNVVLGRPVPPVSA